MQKSDVKYLNRDFNSLKKSLVDLVKVYYPDTYSDFNESSPGMMYINLLSTMGDVLSYYTDATLKENMIQFATVKENVINLAKNLGWKYKTTYPSYTKLRVSQVIPAKDEGKYIDNKYALKIKAGMLISSNINQDVVFTTTEPIDFSNADVNSDDVSPFDVDDNGVVLTYLVYKTVNVMSGNVYEETFVVGDPEKYYTVRLGKKNVIEVISIKDSDLNDWYGVDYLAQDTVFVDDDHLFYTEYDNTDNSFVPYILKTKRTNKRYVTFIDSDDYVNLQFGVGNPNYGLQPNDGDLFNSNTYGEIPYNTTLTVRYYYGGGIESNIGSDELKNIVSVNFINNKTDFDTDAEYNLFNIMKKTLACTNPEPAVGGKGMDTVDEIRESAIAFYHAQDRCVTLQDYASKVKSMPTKYGGVAKAYSCKGVDGDDGKSNGLIELYTLGYNYNKELIVMSDVIKDNIKTYMKHYSVVNTDVMLRDPYIINIQVEFDVIIYSKYNKDEILLKCIDKIKEFFNIDNIQINQTLVLDELYDVLDRVDGVRTVNDIRIFALPTTQYNIGYSGIEDVGVVIMSGESIKNEDSDIVRTKLDVSSGLLKPSADIMIFQLLNPNQNIFGKAK